MPTYEYRCKACGTELEVVQSFTDDALTTCESCGGELRKVFGAVGISFKGSGFYKNDSRSGSGAKTSATSSSGEGGGSGSDGSSSSESSSSSTSESSTKSDKKADKKTDAPKKKSDSAKATAAS